jgi:hypothetical protein
LLIRWISLDDKQIKTFKDFIEQINLDGISKDFERQKSIRRCCDDSKSRRRLLSRLDKFFRGRRIGSGIELPSDVVNFSGLMINSWSVK